MCIPVLTVVGLSWTVDSYEARGSGRRFWNLDHVLPTLPSFDPPSFFLPTHALRSGEIRIIKLSINILLFAPILTRHLSSLFAHLDTLACILFFSVRCHRLSACLSNITLKEK